MSEEEESNWLTLWPGKPGSLEIALDPSLGISPQKEKNELSFSSQSVSKDQISDGT